MDIIYICEEEQEQPTQGQRGGKEQTRESRSIFVVSVVVSRCRHANTTSLLVEDRSDRP